MPIGNYSTFATAICKYYEYIYVYVLYPLFVIFQNKI